MDRRDGRLASERREKSAVIEAWARRPQLLVRIVVCLVRFKLSAHIDQNLRNLFAALGEAWAIR
jgi:hypothetical protein